MGSQENGERVLFEQSCTGMDAAALMPDNVVAGMPICPESIFKSPTSIDPFWDPTVLGIPGGKIANSCVVLGSVFGNTHYSGMLENQAAGSSSHLPHLPSNPGLDELMPRFTNFGSGNFSDMLSSYNVDESVSRSSFPPNQSGNMQCQNLPNGKRKRKNVGVNPSGNVPDSPKEDGEKQSNGTDPCRQAGKQIKDNNSESSKENYIHVRAKRGQATNSHSLAERVRREKISERMKLLQELVPGCSKITGKAVMLDEIINYVQSLQQQVEFLSMKLATVNPELNADIENMLSKDILHSRGGSVGPGISSSHMFSGLPLGNINGFPGTGPPFHSLRQNLWSNELQGILQMGYDSNPSSVSSLPTNGLSKMEQ